MAKYEAGFIGAGNMGGALALAAAKKTGGDRIAVACSTRERSEAAAQRLGCTAETPQRILSDSRFVFLGVKPQMVVGVVESLKADILASEGIFVSMLAGVSLEKLALLLGADKKIIRIMPNTPCAVGQGLILYAANGRVSEDELCAFRELMAPAGALDELNEHLKKNPNDHHSRREERPAPRQGTALCRADAARQRRNGAPHRPAPGTAQGRGVQPRRQHHRGRRRAGAQRLPQRVHRGGGRRRGKNQTARIRKAKRRSVRTAAYCRKSGKTTFSRRLRCVLRLGCPLSADNSTLTPRKVFSAAHRSRQKTNHPAFASADAKLCEAFFCLTTGPLHVAISVADISEADKNGEGKRMSTAALTEAVFYILLSLDAPLHGYGIMQNVERLSGGRVRLAAGTLYGALTTLTERGWIEAVGEDEGRRKEYRITPEGRAAVRVELARLQELTANGEALTRDWA